MDSRLSFAKHANDMVFRTSFKLFTMRRLRYLGANEKCLMIIYRSHILSVITYAAPAWSSLITDGSVAKLDQIQCRALRIIHPDGDYDTNFQTMAVPNIKLHLEKKKTIRCTISSCQIHPPERSGTGVKHQCLFVGQQNMPEVFSLNMRAK